MRVGELFAGYGGLGLAVSAVWPDAELAWYSDVCKFAKDGTAGHHEHHRGPCAIMAHHHPDVPNLGDVTKVDWSQVEPVDILTGGSPCQDLSTAGKRAGMTEGTRSNLWVAMREAIAVLRPGLVIWENVRGAYSAAADSDLEPCEGCMGDHQGEPVLRALGRVLGDLSELGYDAVWHGLRAADIDAPHGRFRVFVVASPTADPFVHGRQGGASSGCQASFPDTEGDHLSDPVVLLPTPTTGEIDLQPTVEAWQDKTRRLAERGSPAATLNLGEAVAFGRTKADLTREALLPTPTSGDAKGARQPTAKNPRSPHNTLSDVRYRDTWGDYAPAIARWERFTRPAPLPTLPDADGPQRLSPVFVEWMMGLPQGHVTDVPGITRTEMLKALGNGVQPQQATAAIRYALSWLGAK